MSARLHDEPSGFEHRSRNLSSSGSEGDGDSPERHWVFIRGLHHSGTSLVNYVLSLHPEIASIKTGHYEDEGQHVQSVFPKMSHRSVRSCQGDLYRCPAFGADKSSVDLASDWQHLTQQWESYIDDSHRPVVVEKTPDLLVSYLAAVSGPAGKFIVVMRHPQAWYWGKTGKEITQGLCCPELRQQRHKHRSLSKGQHRSRDHSPGHSRQLGELRQHHQVGGGVQQQHHHQHQHPTEMQSTESQPGVRALYRTKKFPKTTTQKSSADAARATDDKGRRAAGCINVWLRVWSGTFGDLLSLDPPNQPSNRSTATAAGPRRGPSPWAVIRFEDLLIAPHDTLRATLEVLELNAEAFPFDKVLMKNADRAKYKLELQKKPKKISGTGTGTGTGARKSHRRLEYHGIGGKKQPSVAMVELDLSYLWPSSSQKTLCDDNFSTKDLSKGAKGSTDSTGKTLGCCSSVAAQSKLVKEGTGYDILDLSASQLSPGLFCSFANPEPCERAMKKLTAAESTVSTVCEKTKR